MSTRIFSVEKAAFALSPLLIFPPFPMLEASGFTSTSGWTKGRLEPRFDEDELGTLTTLKFEFVATPPKPGIIVTEVLTPISASYTFHTPPLAATRVIVVAKSNQVEIEGLPEPIRTQVTAGGQGLAEEDRSALLAATVAPAPAGQLPSRRQGTGTSQSLSFEEALQAALHDLDRQPGEVAGSDILRTTRVVSITTFAEGFVGHPLTLQVIVEDTTLRLGS